MTTILHTHIGDKTSNDPNSDDRDVLVGGHKIECNLNVSLVSMSQICFLTWCKNELTNVTTGSVILYQQGYVLLTKTLKSDPHMVLFSRDITARWQFRIQIHHQKRTD